MVFYGEKETAPRVSPWHGAPRKTSLRQVRHTLSKRIRELDPIELRNKNIAFMFRTTAVSMIVIELTGVIAVLIDGIVASQGLGVDAYSGISLFRPFTSVVLMLAGFLSTGCNLVCSRRIGVGNKEEANEVFNLSSFLALAVSAVLILLCLSVPDGVLTLCGVNLKKYPELNPHLYAYMHGYLIGLPALMLVQVFGPVLVMNSEKRLFTISSIALCATDIAVRPDRNKNKRQD